MRKLLNIGVIFFILAIVTACGSEEEDKISEGAQTGPAAPGAAEQASSSPPVPTKPKRLDGLTASPKEEKRVDQPASTGSQLQIEKSTDGAAVSVTPTGSPEERQSGQKTGPEANIPTPRASSETKAPQIRNPVGRISIEGLIPDNPQTNDQVLLQDIYAQIDLEQFALDPKEPIPFQGPRGWQYHISRVYGRIPPTFPFQATKDHPYLFMFPGLDRLVQTVSEGESNLPDALPYHPYMRPTKWGSDTRDKTWPAGDYVPLDRITRFIFNPWYEPIHIRAIREFLPNPRTARIHGPHWFGEKSTRGVLSQAVADALEEGMHPNVRPHPLYWKVPRNAQKTKRFETERSGPKSWDLEDYLRTPVHRTDDYEDKHPNIRLMTGTFNEPETQWEFVHPHLPIVKITSYLETILPLASEVPELSEIDPGTIDHILERYYNKFERERIADPIAEELRAIGIGSLIISGTSPDLSRLEPEQYAQLMDLLPQETKNDLRALSTPLSPTKFAVSFVIAFQNRWNSFDDPNRWLIRFEEDLMGPSQEVLKSRYSSPRSEGARTFEKQQFMTHRGAIDNETHKLFPNYWHTSDYMQHSIIGPVVVQVFESDVIEPGIYSVTPKVTHWEAPGYILPEDWQLMAHGKIWRKHREGIPLFIETCAEGRPFREQELTGKVREWDGSVQTDGHLQRVAVPTSPNPGYPLPGHVMTNAYTEPGTERWEKCNMDDNEW